MADSLSQITDRLDTYLKERNWDNLAPEDLAKCIMIEGAELLEHYQWDQTTRRRDNNLEPKDLANIQSEVADIFIYLLEFCMMNNIDLLDAVNQKMSHNDKKFEAIKMKEGGEAAYKAAKTKYRQNK